MTRAALPWALSLDRGLVARWKARGGWRERDSHGVGWDYPHLAVGPQLSANLVGWSRVLGPQHQLPRASS
jgi:hypothetical protein